MGICIRTPPADPRGIPHVLEHCVLNGSRSFPVRDAFNELSRGSLHTHLNALTLPDRTLYYLGSTSDREFLNLARVYLDLVFHPLLDTRRLLLESVHLQPATREGRHFGRPAGVVYSEMRGSYSDPEELACLRIQSELLPDTPYRFDSGGDPSAMQAVRPEDIREYHSAHYHPANSLILISTSLDGVQEELVAPALEDVPPGPVPDIPLQPRWRIPRTVRAPGGRETASISWLLGETADNRAAAVAQLVEEYLLSDAGSLAPVLEEAGLGSDYSAETGLDLDMRETVFTIGLRGCGRRGVDRFRRAVLAHLSGRSRTDPALAAAALNTLRFRYAERTDDLPLRRFIRATRAWTYGRDPQGWLDHSSVFEGMDVLDAAGAIEQGMSRLAEESHMLLVKPSGGTAAGGRGLVPVTPDVHRGLQVQAGELDAYAVETDEQSALDSIPRLAPSELPMREPHPPVRPDGPPGIAVIDHPGGPGWIEMAFEAGLASPDDDLLLPLLVRSLTGTAAGDLDRRGVALRIATVSGGVDIEPLSLEEPATRRQRPVLAVAAGVPEGGLAGVLDLLADLLTRPSPDDPGRLRDLLDELHGELTADIVPSSDWFAASSAAAALSGSMARRNRWEGLPQIDHLSSLGREEAGLLPGRLKRLASAVFTRRGLVAAACSVSGETDPGALLEAFAGRLPGTAPLPGAQAAPQGARRTVLLSGRGLSSLYTVCRAPRLGDPDAALFTLGLACLASRVLYERIRVAGGAYDAWARHDVMRGLAFMGSHRDPAPSRSFAVMEDSPDLWARTPPSPSDLDLAKVSIFADMQRLSGPRADCRTVVTAALTGMDADAMDSFRRELAGVEAGELAGRFPGMLRDALSDSAQALIAPSGTRLEGLFRDGPRPLVLSGRRFR